MEPTTRPIRPTRILPARLSRIALPALIAATTALVAAPAAAEWPDRPIRLVVPFAVGAMGDTLARLVTDDLQRQLGQPVIVENSGGAGGNIGAARVARAKADGYTFLVAATNNLVINQYLYKDMGFDPLKAFDPVTFLVEVPSVLFSTAKIPPRTFAEFVTYAKQPDRKLNYGSPGAGTTPHLATELINRTHGLGLAHVAYKGAGPAIADLLASEVQLYMGGAGLGAQHVAAGNLHALAVASLQRLPRFPDIPTFAEAGLGDAVTSNWWGVVAPAGTPDPILDRFGAAVAAALAQPQVMQRLDQLGVVATAGSRQAMAEALQTQAVRWQRLRSGGSTEDRIGAGSSRAPGRLRARPG